LEEEENNFEDLEEENLEEEAVEISMEELKNELREANKLIKEEMEKFKPMKLHRQSMKQVVINEKNINRVLRRFHDFPEDEISIVDIDDKALYQLNESLKKWLSLVVEGSAIFSEERRKKKKGISHTGLLICKEDIAQSLILFPPTK